ncbi:hypothetical protein C8Q77DRAFT_1159486 [Trametes polyzona]|nr:hypothetical protein C8Q77DRAFT_1159486 [Trametes polyzona]
MPLSSLPTEVVERILVFAAATNSPESIAAFSQTCRAHRELIYGASDTHLWREIFLATFDDPRESSGGPGWHAALARKRDSPSETPFDWGREYRERVWAAHYIARQTEAPPTSVEELERSSSDPDAVRNNIRALDALISVVQTALPHPPAIVYSIIPSDGAASSPTVGDDYPIFPPVPGTRLDTNRPNHAVGSSYLYGHASDSRNIAWIIQVLANGYPPSVTARFSGKRWDGGTAGQFLDEDDFHEMQSAARLIACTGFLPIPNSSAPPTSPVDATSPESPEPQTISYMSEAAQRKRARRLARMRVYNMRYLGRERHWGPYLAVEDPARKVRFANGPMEDELLQPILALFRAHGQGEENEDDVDDEDEALHEHDHEHDDDDDEEEDEQENEHAQGGADSPGPSDAATRQAAPSASTGPPTPAKLRPDWGYLAAVRTLVEANLREADVGSEVARLFSLDDLRAGSAPWNANLTGDSAANELSSPKSSDKGKEKASGDDGEVVGYDWAGVTGVWKRCVCWMDYRDLILHNFFMQLSGEFDDSRMGEAVRIVGMTLRAQSYSPAEVPGYEHLPTIHVVGQSAGASSGGPPRRIHGTVGVIADGSVRWNLFSSIEGGEVDEWVSEGVQIGGIGSRMGVLGMWTGAQHERMDPLGPTWAWKVA